VAYDLTIQVAARDVTDATIGVGRVGLNVAQQVSTAPVKVNETILSSLLGLRLTIRNLVVFLPGIDAATLAGVLRAVKVAT
jgi:hypothetical protein